MSVQKEFNFILGCLSNYINGSRIEISDDIDFNEVSKYATFQQMECIVYNQIMPSFAKIIASYPDVKKLNSVYNQSVFLYSNRVAILSKIEKLFTENNVEFIIIKGIEIASYFPQPFFRSMGDCDILVKEECKKKADELLISLGLINENRGPNEWVYHYGDIEFELHHRLMNDEEGKTREMQNYFDDAWNHISREENSCKCHFEINFHFVFLLLHLYKHFINSGVGFRMFFDLAVLQKRAQLDWEYIIKSLKQLKLYDFALVCFSLVEKWFNVKMPYTTNITDDFYQSSTDFIMKNGVFGFDNEDNKNNYEIYKISKSNNRFFSKLKSAILFLFPPYKLMKEIPHYAFVNKKPFLMPIAWIYRFFKMIFSKKTKGSLSVAKQNMIISGEQIESRINTLKKWGL